MGHWVYIPFDGATVKGQECYCDNCASGSPCITTGGLCTDCGKNECKHAIGFDNLCCPIDVSGPASTGVKLVVSSGIKSIRTIKVGRSNVPPYDPQNQIDAICSLAPPAGYEWVDEGVKVELWSGLGATGSKMGTVAFGHLRSRVANGVYDNPSFAIRTLGLLGNSNPDVCCYHGIHVHVAAANGVYKVYPAYRRCDTAVGTGNAMYYFA